MKADHKEFEEKAEAERDALLKRAEQAEEQMKGAVRELTGLKLRISKMANVVFGPRSANLHDDCVFKLKAIYTLIEQLCIGGMMTIKAVMGDKEPVKSIKYMLGWSNMCYSVCLLEFSTRSSH
ncbi:uncharacterized protein LOC123430054 [Hordeum vulgare subsp. vulgare]|uniref:uncharacterized protein LOC123430054 n=1 Tax=Hordeum vulgare subsp. vulgare TaxID=112509 RepID=UPI001D1A4883|nr:uncharacterized protein LOC123430054 [Hordeum vulgare subsp. vulgare]